MIIQPLPATFKQWLTDQFNPHQLTDIFLYGAYQNYCGLSSYADTTLLYQQYHRDVWALLRSERDKNGYNSCLDLLTKLTYVETIASDAEFKNLLIWYATEKFAFQLTEGRYENLNSPQEENDDTL